MKFAVLLIAASPLFLSLAACETLTQTPGENRNRVAHAIDSNGKQIPDDVEDLLLVDRPSRLTKDPVPNQ